MNNRAQNEYQLILNEMKNFDIDKNQEDVKIPYISTTGSISTGNDTVSFNGDGSFILHIRNDGPQLVSIEYIGLLIGGEEPDNTPCYQSVELNILPSQVETFELNFTSEHHQDTTAQIQIVTNRGNIFPFEYPQDLKNYPYSYILQGAISKVIGRVLPEYDSFRYGMMDGSTRDLPYMNQSWVVIYDNQADYVFSVQVSHYGKTPLTLSEKTGIFFECLDGNRELLECYIVYNSSNSIYPYQDITLPAYYPDVQDEPTPVTLYFATDKKGGDPLGDPFDGLNSGYRYQLKLGIFDKNEIYAQTFPLIAIEVT
jgi:hypothetical protein